VLDYLCEVVRGDAAAGSDAAEVAWTTEGELGSYSLASSASRMIQKAFEMVRRGAG
jgi:hypothetical protein